MSLALDITVSITKRMKEMGYDEFHVEPIRVLPGSQTVEIIAHNEYWWLTADTMPAAAIIISDHGMWNIADSAGYAGYNFFGFQEFGGNIFIDNGAGNIDMEFYRAIPN